MHLRGAARRPAARALWFAAVAVDAFAIYLSAYRTMLGVVAAGFVFIALGRVFVTALPSRHLLAKLAAVVLMVGGAVAAGRQLAPGPSQPLAIDGPVTLGDGIFAISSRWSFRVLPGASELIPISSAPEHGQDRAPAAPPPLSGGFLPSYAFRAHAWENAIAKIEASPYVGIGFGPPAALFPDRPCVLATSPVSNCGNAHNTYLTLAMRMGVPALLLFLAINVVIVSRLIARLRRGETDADRLVLASFASVAYPSCLAFASLSLFFESPYLSVVFWVLLGCMASLGARPEAAGTPA